MKDTGSETVPGNATKFSGIAIKQNGSNTIQLQLEDPNDGNYACM